jgi:hypothetical protein
MKTRALEGFVDPTVKRRLLAIHHVRRLGGFLDGETVEFWVKSLNSQFFTKLLKSQ